MLAGRLKNWLFNSRSRRNSFSIQSAYLQASDELETRQLLSAVTVQLGASKDTTIYQNEADLSNGSGEFIVSSGASRGLLQFDVGTGTIPEGSVIIDAVLTMNVGFSSGGSTGVSVQRIASSWGEAGSDASGDETTGAPAEQFDATWLYSSFDGEFWNSPGGDVAGAATSAAVGEVGSYEWIGGGLIDDVQAWVDGIAPNFGWLVSSGGSAVKAFVSKDAPGGLAPVLEITYEPPPAPEGIVEGRIWNDVNTDGKSADPAVNDLNLSVFRQTYFNAFGGEEYWFRSANDSSWYYLTPDAKLTKWSGVGQELSGETVTYLDPAFYYNPSLVVQQVNDPEGWIDGHTVELLNSEGSVVATTVTGSRDLNRDGSIDPATEGGWYRFTNVASDGTFSVRQVLPEGWHESAKVDVDISSGMQDFINGLNLESQGSAFENYGGLGEKWARSATNGWHYITPEGELYRWNSRPVTPNDPLTGTLVAKIGTQYYDDLSRLTNGNYTEDNFQEGDLLFRVDFGTYQAQTISGRVWLDFYADGIRTGDSHLVDQLPDYELQYNETWFFDAPNDDWYVIDADGQPQYFGKSPAPSGTGTGNSGANGGGIDEGGGLPEGPETGVSRTAIYQLEPWLNQRTVELLDSDGVVVASTTTRSIDFDQNGVIDIETERGHYVFEDVAPGEYTIRTVSDESWVQTSPVTASQSEAIGLDSQYGFRSTGSDFFNWGGQQERWIIDAVGRWYYILPEGDLYQWTPGTGSGSELSGTKIASLSSRFYNDVSLLTTPDTGSTTVHVTPESVSDNLVFGNHRVLGDLLSSTS